jgi:sialic acid synthase SpsE
MIINGREISRTGKTYIIAEAGANHNGDKQTALKMIDAAKDACADAIKFQTYTPEELLCDHERSVVWHYAGGAVTEPVGKMFERVALKRSEHEEVFAYATKRGITVFSTPFSPDGVRFLDSLGAPCFKVASSDIVYFDMLKAIAEAKKPVILSAGKAALAELDAAVEFLEESVDLAILHCVAKYPTDYSDANLNTIKTLLLQYPNCVIGFSDHTRGISCPLGAVTLGARIIEKHFTLDNFSYGPDHEFSLNPAELSAMVKEIRNLEAALGSSRKRIGETEISERTISIRSITVIKEVKKGEILTAELLDAKRPGVGISPLDKEKIIGLAVNKDIPAGSTLRWDDLK